jgi:transposase
MRAAAAHPQWVAGFADEAWWSRLAPPDLSAWQPPGPALRLVEQRRPPADREPKAIACYGLLLHGSGYTGQPQGEPMWLRFVEGRPVGARTCEFLAWCCLKLEEAGKRVLALIWDNAAWHISAEVTGWIRAHNRQVKASGQGVRILALRLPSHSPWLNPIEPKWMHGKRRVLEAGRVLTAEELRSRICAAYGSRYEQHVCIPQPLL